VQNERDTAKLLSDDQFNRLAQNTSRLRWSIPVWWGSGSKFLPHRGTTANEAQPFACVLAKPYLHSFADPNYEMFSRHIRAGVKLSTEGVTTLNLQTDRLRDGPRPKFGMVAASCSS